MSPLFVSSVEHTQIKMKSVFGERLGILYLLNKAEQSKMPKQILLKRKKKKSLDHKLLMLYHPLHHSIQYHHSYSGLCQHCPLVLLAGQL